MQPGSNDVVAFQGGSPGRQHQKDRLKAVLGQMTVLHKALTNTQDQTGMSMNQYRKGIVTSVVHELVKQCAIAHVLGLASRHAMNAADNCVQPMGGHNSTLHRI
jgi:hypothetical protein